MGQLVDGKWHDQWYDTQSTGGKFKREQSQFRNTIKSDDAVEGRYHLFYSPACPWAHRALIFRELKQLQSIIGVTSTAPLMLEHGWEFSGEYSHDNPLGQLEYAHQVYTTAAANYTGRVTVPILWDKEKQTIVNNESAEIIRIFNTAFNDLTGNVADYYPLKLRSEIDEINAFVYHNINNGVYKVGFATEQAAYDEAFEKLFNAIEVLEERLSKQRYLVGAQITEADWRLFTTLIRFDAVYVGHFKCNKKQLREYSSLFNYICELYQIPGIADTINFAHIKQHYYGSHKMINPTQIVPLGPVLDFNLPHNRG